MDTEEFNKETGEFLKTIIIFVVVIIVIGLLASLCGSLIPSDPKPSSLSIEEEMWLDEQQKGFEPYDGR